MTPTASADEATGRWMVVNFLPTAMTTLPRHMAGPGLKRSPAHPNHRSTFLHSPPLRTHATVPVLAAHQPLSSRACRRTTAEAARLPARAGDGRVGGSGPRGWPGRRRPRAEVGPEATRGACGGHPPGPWARSAGCLRAGLPPSKPYLVAPTAHVGGRGVYKLN